MNINRTDITAEEIGNVSKEKDGVSVCVRGFGDVFLTSVEITEEGEKNTHRAAGNYITLSFGSASETVEELMKQSLLRLMKTNGLDGKCILVCGLGNASITPDSLGTKTAAGVLATAHLKALDDALNNDVYVLTAGVTAQTGMETSRLIKAVSDEIKPDYIIAVDALACRERDRLCRTVQLTDSGIAPGSGVGNNRTALSEKLFGVPCIAVGVPTVIDFEGDMMVCPRDIDVRIRDFSKLISVVLNDIFNPKLTRNEIQDILLA